MISIDEWKKRERPAEPGQARTREIRGLEQEVVRATALTGDRNWDHFLRYVEAQIKAAERLVEHHKGKAAEMVLLDEARARHHAVLCAAGEVRAQTLRDVISIPKWIIEQGKKAEALISGLESEA